MKMKFLKDIDLGVHHFKTGDIVELNGEDPMLRDLNEKYYIFVYHGVRFDLHRDNVEIFS